MYIFIRANLEAIIWIAALVLLAFSSPHEEHYSLCVFHNLGFSYCPGCGIGHSISYFFHGEIVTSFHAHPLGIVAIGIIFFRIVQLTVFKINPYKI
ncbi:MAG: DUF2752 domain-containing protein [Bacteroidetes bacterium]|nr:DUF2752 domain-containing protein [Bacteroidota bacterium]